MMREGALVVLGAQATIREAVEQVRAREADFAVIRNGEDLFAFRPHELEAVEDPSLTALEALALEPWKKSCPVRTSGAERPPLLGDALAPSSLRFVIVDASGEPLRVEEPRGRSRLVGGPPPAAAARAPGEGTTIVRYPSIAASGPRRQGATLLLRIDLALGPDAQTAADPFTFDALPEDWRRLPISVVATSPQLEFAAGANEGTILVRRDMASVACVLPATVTAEGEARVDVTVMFSRDDRWCGTAQRTLTGDDDTPTTGAVCCVSAAVAPDLTIHIHRDSVTPGRLHWLMSPAVAHRGLVDGNLCGETRLEAEPSAFVRQLFKIAAGKQPGQHVGVMQGIGETLWAQTPPTVQAGYWKLRDALGDGFSIQLLTDEPWIPWELMRPVRAGAKDARLMAETHPVARGLLAYPDRLRPTLPADGERLTVAPDYLHRAPSLPRLPPLDQALDESAALQERFHATAVEPGTARELLDILEDRRGTPVQLLHFAGHGAFNAQALFSSIAFEDADLLVTEIRRQDVVLGERYKTFVIFNACEVGATGDVLGEVGGWAEAFAYRDFSGFLAPLWAVFDGHARQAMEAFLDAVLVQKQRIGPALRDVRRDHGRASATFLSYVYYGDVNARFG